MIKELYYIGVSAVLIVGGLLFIATICTNTYKWMKLYIHDVPRRQWPDEYDKLWTRHMIFYDHIDLVSNNAFLFIAVFIAALASWISVLVFTVWAILFYLRYRERKIKQVQAEMDHD